jgi:hypothetical protein
VHVLSALHIAAHAHDAVAIHAVTVIHTAIIWLVITLARLAIADHTGRTWNVRGTLSRQAAPHDADAACSAFVAGTTACSLHAHVNGNATATATAKGDYGCCFLVGTAEGKEPN